jgi:hypothetical protein
LLCHVMSKNWVPQNTTFLSSISHPFFPILGLTSPFWDVTTPKDSIVSHVIKLSALHPIVSTSYIYIHILCLCVFHYISITVCSILSQLNPTISQWHPIISRLYISHKKKTRSISIISYQNIKYLQPCVLKPPKPKCLARILQAASGCMLDAIVLPSEAKDKVLTPLRQVWTQVRWRLWRSWRGVEMGVSENGVPSGKLT